MFKGANFMFYKPNRNQFFDIFEKFSEETTIYARLKMEITSIA